ncbi:MAG: MarR family winged helix-turn-helix transcriptional regulator [Clostridia bacterium]|nr:MarR family winged helix-turn-helix transcriptional regulator [Clostridia bacterium]
MNNDFFEEFGNSADKLILLLRVNLLAPIQDATKDVNNCLSRLSMVESGVVGTIAIYDNCTIKQLRRRTSVTYQYLCRIIDGMESKGMVKKIPNPNDSKSFTVSFTDEMRQNVDKFNSDASVVAGMYLGNKFSDEELEDMKACMDKLNGYFAELGERKSKRD